MNSTAYNGVTNLVKGLPIMGGLCKFWFIPQQEVYYIPPVNPLNQVLTGEPVLKTGKYWRGPVPVPDRQLGFKEAQKLTKSGPTWEIKVGVSYAGEIPSTRANFNNMAFHKYLVVGKLRASGAYILIGNLECGADFMAEYDSGTAAGNAVVTKCEFSTEQIHNAMVMAEFNGDESGYIDFSSETQVISNSYWELE